MLRIIPLILPIFLVLGCGVVLRVLKAADENWVRVLNRYGLYIGFPALIFESLIHIEGASLIQNLPVYGLNIVLLVAILTLLIVPLKIFKVRNTIANTYIICTFFGNVAYLGYPVVTSVFPNAAGEVSIIIAIYVIILFTIGIGVLEVSKSEYTSPFTILLNIAKNPFIAAVALGIVFIRYGISLPAYLVDALRIIKGSASPVVIISLGIFIAQKVPLRRTWKHSLAITVVRLFAIPALFSIAGWSLDMGSEFFISIVEAGMPLAVTPFALSSVYPLDREVIVSAIVLSTIISIFTLPGIIAFLQ